MSPEMVSPRITRIPQMMTVDDPLERDSPASCFLRSRGRNRNRNRYRCARLVTGGLRAVDTDQLVRHHNTPDCGDLSGVETRFPMARIANELAGRAHYLGSGAVLRAATE